MKRVITLLVIFFGIQLLTVSCNSSLSSTKWGVLQYYSSAVLLKVPPKGKVTVCADNSQVGNHVSKAVLEWATAAGRGGYISSDTECSSDADLKMTVKAIYSGTAYSSYTIGTITYNVNNQNMMTYSVMLHEVGHAWGLCDQYQGVNNCNDNVQGHGNWNKENNSIMSYGNRFSSLQPDDIAGIRYIVDQPGVAQNDAWKEFLNDPDKKPIKGEDSSKPAIFIKPNGRFIDIYVSYTSSLTYCIGSKETCKESQNQRNMDSESIGTVGTVNKVTYISPERITADTPFNIYSNGELVRSFYLK